MYKKNILEDILIKMTLDEKIGQLMQIIPLFYLSEKKDGITGPLNDLNIDENSIWGLGSILGLDNAKDMIEIQKKYLEKSRLKIPLIFMADVIHGFRTIFPIPLALGCTWDTDTAKKCAEISAKEAALSGIHVTFSPMADLVRDPRWGRVIESTGEDPYLNGLFAKAFVEGYQGDMTGKYNIAACVKHFAAYGAAESGREYNTVDMSKRNLFEYYLPAYKAAIDAGVELVMTSFNIVNGIPATANEYLMRDILRKKWGFDGIVISDWAAIKELIAHGVAKDEKEAAEKAIKAGVDIEMMTSSYVNNLKALIEEGKIQENLIDEAVLRILALKNKLGLFENPYKSANQEEAEKTYLCNEHRKATREVAEKSFVLLKNNNILPFKKEQKVAVIGPFAYSDRVLGQWAPQGKEEEAVSLLEGIQNKIGNDMVIAADGCEISGDDMSGFGVAIKIAEEADVIILALGEDQSMSGEAASRAYINLPGVQEQLAKEIFKLGKPTSVVLFNGRPLELTSWQNEADAILEAWFPGSEAGNAIANVLFGDVNPSGRLSMSIPYTVGQIPVYYNSFNTGRPENEGEEGNKYVSKYIDIPNEPLYPFGYGLSYTQYEYGDMKLDKKYMKSGEKIKATVCVKNIGKVSGIETVQLYIRDKVGSVVRPLKELKGFKRIQLEPNEEKIVIFEIDEEMLKYYDSNCNYIAEKGEFVVFIGHDSQTSESISFELI